jgi:uncharacterized membrane protein
MQFVYTTLTWGFLLALVPLAIHLINMMRHRRVQWAAMEFLLASYKKHRQWVWLKQLLLLLVRMAVVALVVAMLARLVSRNAWSALLGGKATHHFVLLDDSYSMSDRTGATSAFDVAGQVMARIVAQANQSDFEHKVTLVRFSRAERAADMDAVDFNGEIIDKKFDLRLEAKRRTFDPTELAVGPNASLRLAKQLVSDAAQDQNIVYVLSDFRTNEWLAPTESRQSLEEIAEAGAKVRLVQCVRNEQSNLSIEQLAPTSDTRAAGVPLFVNVTVRNYGRQVAKRVQVKVKTTFFDPAKLNPANAEANVGESEELPVVLYDEIAAGEAATQRVQVYFPAAGQHVVQGTLPDDPVAADNRRWCVIDFPDGEPVLVIDGHPKQRNAFYLTSAFMPGQRANTGVRPEVHVPEFLRDVDAAALAKYRAIYLLDVPKLDAAAVAKLESYAEQGGGIGIFVGPNVNVAAWNSGLFKDGHGLAPAPLDREDELLPDPLENKPDIMAERHSMFDPLLDEQNPLIRLVNVERYLRVRPTWTAGKSNAARVIASLRNHAPLVVEQPFGQGRVVCFLTTAAPDWNGWANDPTFVVLALKMQSYLAKPPASDREQRVGTAVETTFSADKFLPEVTFVTPGAQPGSRMVVDRTAAADGSMLKARLGDSDRSGLYEVWRRSLAGEVQLERFALNVDPREGNLAVVSETDLAARLAPVKVEVSQADQDVIADNEAANNFSLPLMVVLVGLLLLEQLLAYSSSYHPLPQVART